MSMKWFRCEDCQRIVWYGGESGGLCCGNLYVMRYGALQKQFVGGISLADKMFLPPEEWREKETEKLGGL